MNVLEMDAIGLFIVMRQSLCRELGTHTMSCTMFSAMALACEPRLSIMIKNIGAPSQVIHACMMPSDELLRQSEMLRMLHNGGETSNRVTAAACSSSPSSRREQSLCWPSAPHFLTEPMLKKNETRADPRENLGDSDTDLKPNSRSL